MSQTVEEHRHRQQAFCYEVVKTWCEEQILMRRKKRLQDAMSTRRTSCFSPA
jgi:hypothetical protein